MGAGQSRGCRGCRGIVVKVVLWDDGWLVIGTDIGAMGRWLAAEGRLVGLMVEVILATPLVDESTLRDVGFTMHILGWKLV